MQQALSRIIAQHPVLTYSLARVVLFAVVVVPMYLVGMRGWVLLAVALLVSGALSLVLLDGVRAQFSGRLVGYFQRLNQRIDDATTAEDDDPLDGSGLQGQPQSEPEPRQ